VATDNGTVKRVLVWLAGIVAVIIAGVVVSIIVGGFTWCQWMTVTVSDQSNKLDNILLSNQRLEQDNQALREEAAQNTKAMNDRLAIIEERLHTQDKRLDAFTEWRASQP